MIDHTFLQQFPLLQGMEHDDLHVIVESVEVVRIQAGEELFHEGDEGTHAFFLQKGDLEILKESSNREVLIAVRSEGTVIGEIALLASTPRTATVRARSDAVLYAIGKEALDQLLQNSPSAMRSMFNTILDRFQEDHIQLRQSEKMAQLGTLTAGVAHELNNPAAAVKRSAVQLSDAIQSLDSSYAAIGRFDFSEKQWKVLEDLSEEARISANSPPELDALARMDRESEIEAWLEEQDIEEAWLIAPNLVNLKFTEEQWSALGEEFPTTEIKSIMDWLNNSYLVFRLLNEIAEGSGRISSIVKSLKSYAYLDQAPIQDVNIKEGLENTLTILHNNFKSGISVEREYDPNLPDIVGFGSELNQVWTNILVNAADALQDQENGKIIIRTRKEGKWVVVEIEDNGPGIPEEKQSKIFDAFYTTKGPGKGTGLGLNITYSIIVRQHHGDIKVKSKPGQTVFQVWLPINFEN